MPFLSIMQGRLGEPEDSRFQSFPRTRWRGEFASTHKANLDGIEWIYDRFGREENPLLTTDGRIEMHDLSRKAGVAVRSVCADYYIDIPILRQDAATRTCLQHDLGSLINNCCLAGITRIVLPFVDSSRIQSEDDQSALIAFVEQAIPASELAGVELHLETDLSPTDFKNLLRRLDNEIVKVNYDSGNSASLGYDCREELDAYGSRIGSVHVKDRVRGGATVPLGEGDSNLPILFSLLSDLGYGGDFVLQAARGGDGDEIAWATSNAQFVRNLLSDAGF